MSDILRKTYLFGLGLASMTKEKVEEVVDDLVQKGEVTEKDRGDIMSDLWTKAKEEQQRLSETVRENVKHYIGEMRVPSRAQYDELLKRIEDLEQRLQGEEEPKEDVSTSEDD
jgi:polyhydroxyalkanoate synthesis regulator phasin